MIIFGDLRDMSYVFIISFHNSYSRNTFNSVSLKKTEQYWLVSGCYK